MATWITGATKPAISVRIAAVAIAFVAAVGLSTSRADARTDRAVRIAVATLQEIPNACKWNCVGCYIFPIYTGHKRVEAEPSTGDFTTSDGWTTCEMADCGEAESICITGGIGGGGGEDPVQPADLDALLAAAKARNTPALGVLLRRSGIELNVARSAVQAIGCGGIVVAHVPLPRAGTAARSDGRGVAVGQQLASDRDQSLSTPRVGRSAACLSCWKPSSA